jgi:hypothetical protein
MFDIGSESKIAAGNHFHYFVCHHNALYCAFKDIVGAASCGSGIDSTELVAGLPRSKKVDRAK